MDGDLTRVVADLGLMAAVEVMNDLHDHKAYTEDKFDDIARSLEAQESRLKALEMLFLDSNATARTEKLIGYLPSELVHSFSSLIFRFRLYYKYLLS